MTDKDPPDRAAIILDLSRLRDGLRIWPDARDTVVEALAYIEHLESRLEEATPPKPVELQAGDLVIFRDGRNRKDLHALGRVLTRVEEGDTSGFLPYRLTLEYPEIGKPTCVWADLSELTKVEPGDPVEADYVALGKVGEE